MRAFVLVWCSTLLGGCSGENIVAGEEKTAAEQLEASLATWCRTTCEVLTACPGTDDCDCSEDVCSCSAIGDDCPQQCLEELARYTKGDDECAAAGLRFQKCVDRHGCSFIADNDLCAPTDAEAAACPSDRDSADGGSKAGPNGGTLLPSAAVTCEGAYGSGGGPSEGSAMTCSEGRADCSDGHVYDWLCASDGRGRSACSCLLDGEAVGAFTPGTSCPELSVVNAGCGWNLVDEP